MSKETFDEAIAYVRALDAIHRHSTRNPLA